MSWRLLGIIVVSDKFGIDYIISTSAAATATAAATTAAAAATTAAATATAAASAADSATAAATATTTAAAACYKQDKSKTNPKIFSWPNSNSQQSIIVVTYKWAQ
jgi:hypothetical protein